LGILGILRDKQRGLDYDALSEEDLAALVQEGIAEVRRTN
jgi:hypothetical protein